MAYHENGDLVVVSSMPEGVKDIPAGETTLIDTRIPNRYDMVFTGWNTKADGTGTSYLPGETVVVSEHPELDAEINTLHLYAQWVKATQYRYKVRYLEAQTNTVLKDPIVYGDQIYGNKIYSKDESEKATADIPNYIFSYANPQIGSDEDYIVIDDDNSKNVITLYYMPRDQEILATALFIKKTDDDGNPLANAEFELSRQNGGSPKTYISDSEGIVEIPFTEDPGPNETDIYTYTLVESKAPDYYEKSNDTFSIEVKRGAPKVKSFLGGITKTVFPLEAKVTKDGTVIDSDDITVINRFNPDPISLPIEATKTLEGRKLKASEFSFALYDKDDNKLATATNTADGKITFTGIEVEKAGVYTYKMSEIKGTDDSVKYDDTVYTVTITVVVDNNKLKISETKYEKDGKEEENIIFVNKAESEMFSVTYKLNGGIYNNSKDDIVEYYPYNTKIKIHDAPTREGYKFLYWKGSKYQPGDEYTVKEDKVFIAQWEYIDVAETGNNIKISILMLLTGLTSISGAVLLINRKKLSIK